MGLYSRIFTRSRSFFRRVGAVAASLVKALCRNEPYERLGSGTSGFDDIRKHRFAEHKSFLPSAYYPCCSWFTGFDWHALRRRAMPPPILPTITSPTDTSNFDQQPLCDEDAPDETSGWDKGF